MTTIIEFGSRRHGCDDYLSDKDIYVLYGAEDNIAGEKTELERQGYSVTTSTRSRAEYLAASGSLFVRHVFFEGSVISGSEKDMVNIKNLWCAASSYEREIEENVEMLALLESVPSTRESLATINDIIICSLRNVLIRKLANKGIFIFSWKEVLAEGKKHNFISETDVAIMYQARRYKNIYRSGFPSKIDSGFLASLEEISKKVIDKRRKIQAGCHKEILAAPEKMAEGSYSQLRAIELLCSHYHFAESMRNYSILVKDPAYFSTFGPNKALKRANSCSDDIISSSET